MKLPPLAIAIALLLLQTSASAALSVRVDASQGAPRLTVNGQPVRARMFFGICRLLPPAPVLCSAERYGSILRY